MNAKRWNPSSFPFQADYNDHFETPKQSYVDILPILDFIAHTLSLTRSNLIVYDPFYCNGQAKVLLESLGFTNVQHDKRDFYKDIQSNQVPIHHVLVTNPPYSENHKERIVEYTVEKLRTNNIPFFLLMPNYVAIKEYFRKSIRQNRAEEDPSTVFYILPATKYQYHHPEGTGKEESPFDSIWYCGLPESMISSAIASFNDYHGRDRGSAPRLVRSMNELKLCRAVPTSRRRNPKQRRKERARLDIPKPESKDIVSSKETMIPSRKVKSSVYRVEKGIRKKRRF